MNVLVDAEKWIAQMDDALTYARTGLRHAQLSGEMADLRRAALDLVLISGTLEQITRPYVADAPAMSGSRNSEDSEP